MCRCSCRWGCGTDYDRLHQHRPALSQPYLFTQRQTIRPEVRLYMGSTWGAIRVLHWKFISDLISARVSVRGLRTDTQSQPYKLHHIIIKYMIKLYICRICSMFYFITRRMRITVMRKYVNETLFRSKEAFLVIHVFASESKWWICFAWQFSKLQIIYL